MSRTFKKLSLQYSYLKLEKEEVDELCGSVEKKMRTYMEKNYPQYYNDFFADQSKDIKHEDPKHQEKETKLPKNKDLKKLYRKIASKIHPDKTSDVDAANLFAEAAKAYADNDVGKMIEIASLNNIEITELSFETIDLLQKNIEEITRNIATKKNTSGWAWHKAKTDEDKFKIIKYILHTKGVSI